MSRKQQQQVKWQSNDEIEFDKVSNLRQQLGYINQSTAKSLNKRPSATLIHVNGDVGKNLLIIERDSQQGLHANY